MKKVITLKEKLLLLIPLIAIAISFSLNAQVDTWTQKANFGGGARYDAVGFSIDGKGYIGTGYNYPSYFKDFWEYDPNTNTWSQKANFGGTARANAVGFSIGSKGYIGTGYADLIGATKDFWEYDPNTNKWKQKSDFEGTATYGAVGFSIAGKGYISSENSNGTSNEFWEYDPNTNAWTKKADFGGTAKAYAVGFSIGSKGYLGTGLNIYSGYTNDFWEYDPNTNTWMQKADFGGTVRYSAVGFSIDSNGYIGTGIDYDGYTNDFWQYDPATNLWTQRADLGGEARLEAVGFSIAGKGYIGTGRGNPPTFNDFWEYTPDTSLCIIPSNLSAGKITSASANLKWDAVSDAEKYKIRYEIAGTNTWTTLYPVAHHKVITGLLPNTAYTWQVKTVCQTDSPSLSSPWSAKQHFTTASSRLIDDEPTQPVIQIYPNPAHDNATIQFTLPHSSKVRVIVCDVSGREIEVLMNDQLPAGEHSLQLNTSKFSRGVYVVKMITGFGIQNKKIIVQ